MKMMINDKLIGRVLIYIGVILLTLSVAAGESVIWGVMGITYNGMDYWHALADCYTQNWLTLTVAMFMFVAICETSYQVVTTAVKK